MMNNPEIINQLKELGLNDKEAQVYLMLLQKSALTPLELSRTTKINRTTIYRILENLKEVGVVEEILDQKSTKYQAGAPEKLKMLLTKKEAELSKLREILPDLITNLSVAPDTAPSPTKVIYFRGKSGLQQLLWNTLKSPQGSTVVGYGYLDWNEYLGEKFAEKLRREYVEREIYSLEICNKTYDSFTKNTIYLQKIYEERLISKSKLEINHNTYIYNDVFCFYGVFAGERFGIEIHNAEIAKTQRQIFYLLWKQAKKV